MLDQFAVHQIAKLTCFICSLVSLKFRLFTCLTKLRMCVSGVFSWLSTFIILRISCQFLNGCLLFFFFLLLLFGFVFDLLFLGAGATRIFEHTDTVRRRSEPCNGIGKIFDVFVASSSRFSFQLRRNLANRLSSSSLFLSLFLFFFLSNSLLLHRNRRGPLERGAISSSTSLAASNCTNQINNKIKFIVGLLRRATARAKLALSSAEYCNGSRNEK